MEKPSDVIVPRSFLLLDYMDQTKKFSTITYGLIEEDDKTYENNFRTFEHWNGSLLYEIALRKIKKDKSSKSSDEEEQDTISIINFTFICPQEKGPGTGFPYEGPKIKFTPESLEYECIARICTKDGYLNDAILKRIPWSPKYTLGDYFVKLRGLIA